MTSSLHYSKFSEEESNPSQLRFGKFSSGWNWSCPNPECVEYEIKANVNIVVAKIYGKRHIRLLRCRTCQTTFSERRSSPFYGSHADENLILEAMFHLAHGRSIRMVARTLGIDKDTVCRWMDKACQATGQLKSFLAEVQVPEPMLSTFIGSLEKRNAKRAS